VSALAPTLQAFFTDRLIAQRHVSAHTIAAYRDTLRLLLGYAAEHTGQAPSALGRVSHVYRAGVNRGRVVDR
jgi:integrase/recombinase XerD